MIKVICGKTASGKDTIVRELVKRGYERIVSYTTRPPRSGEKDGVDYHFKSHTQLVDVACARTYNTTEGIWRYWFNKTVVSSAIESPNTYICITDAEGAAELKALGADIIYVFCDFKTRFERYYKREMRNENPNMAEMNRRLVADEEDFERIENEAMDEKIGMIINDGTKKVNKVVDAAIASYF